jgi:hypothetical protein
MCIRDSGSHDAAEARETWTTMPRGRADLEEVGSSRKRAASSSVLLKLCRAGMTMRNLFLSGVPKPRRGG